MLLHFTPSSCAGKNGLLQLSSGHKLYRSSHRKYSVSADDLERANLSVGFPSSISIKPSSLSPIHYSSPFSSSVSLFLWLSWQNQGIFLSDCSCVLLCIHSKITINLKFGRDNSSDFLLSHSLQQASALISSYVSPGSSVQQAEARDGSGGHHHHGHHAEHGKHHHVDHAAAAPVSDICILVVCLGFEKNTN